MFFENKRKIKPIKKTNEKIKSELPYPPRVTTRTPTKNTAAQVKILPVLKHRPVAVALME
jgi:hypothetical protein